MPQYKVVLNRFDGGLNTKANSIHGLPNESPDLQDVTFDDLGAVATRRGYGKFNSSTIGTAQVDMLHTYTKNDGSEEMLAACNGSLFRNSANTFITVPSAQSVYTSDVPIQAINFQNKAFLTNGYARPYKYDGTNFTKWGVSAPSAATVAISSAGTLTGEYTYTILGVNSAAVQGSYGSATTTITCASQKAYLTEIPVFPTSAGVNTKLICRNTADVGGFYYIVTSIANATTVYEDDHDDSELSTEAPSDNDPPTYFTSLVQHLGRIFGASASSSDPMFLWFSNANEPEIFPSSNFLRVGEGDGYPISGLAILSNSLIVAKNDGTGNGSMYLIYTPDNNSSNWQVTRLDTAYGGQATRVMTKFGNFLAWINRYGVFDLNEFAVGEIKSDALSFNIESDIFTLAEDFINVAAAITWKNKLWISVPFGSTQQTNNRIYQYDFIRGRSEEGREAGAWSRFTNHNVSDFTIYDGDLYGASSDDDGWIYKLDTDYNDDTSSIDSYFKTMAITGLEEHINHTKVWRYCYVTVECTGDWFMEVSYINDFKDEVGNSVQIDLDPGGDTWDSAIIGQDTWGPGFEKKRIKVRFRNSVSKALQLKFATNVADEYFKVHEVEVYYNVRGLR